MEIHKAINLSYLLHRVPRCRFIGEFVILKTQVYTFFLLSFIFQKKGKKTLFILDGYLQCNRFKGIAELHLQQ